MVRALVEHQRQHRAQEPRLGVFARFAGRGPGTRQLTRRAALGIIATVTPTRLTELDSAGSVLFLGAGFSRNAQNIQGRRLPTGGELKKQ